MKLNEYLSVKNIELSAILPLIQNKIDLLPTDSLFIVGSVSEGIATKKSDLDILLITSRNTMIINEGNSISLIYNKCLIEVRIMLNIELEELLSKFENWKKQSWAIAISSDLIESERRLLHRLLHRIPLKHNKCDTLQSLDSISKEDLSRLKYQVARHAARTVQVDMMGHKLSGDYRSLLYASQELLRHAVDSLLANNYNTNTYIKWHSRFLDIQTDFGLSLLNNKFDNILIRDIVWDFHKFPDYSNINEVSRQVYRISAFCKYVFFLSELRLVHPENLNDVCKINYQKDYPTSVQPPLPLLEIDLDFAIDGQNIIIGRLNEYGDNITVNFEEFSLLLMLDGETKADQAIASLYGKNRQEEGMTILKNLLQQCEQQQLTLSLNQHELLNLGVTNIQI